MCHVLRVTEWAARRFPQLVFIQLKLLPKLVRDVHVTLTLWHRCCEDQFVLVIEPGESFGSFANDEPQFIEDV